MAIYHHEAIHRGEDLLKEMARLKVFVCGAGALGANLCETLARSGFKQLSVIDFDRVEERNLSTQPFQKGDIGALKAQMLANNIYRAVGVKINAIPKKLEEHNIRKFLKNHDLVLDVFDNSVSRALVKNYCTEAHIPCLHVGLSGDYAEVIWNDLYRVPSDINDDVCDYPLARNLVTLAVSVASETIIQYLSTHQKNSYTITLNDFAVKPFGS